MKNFEEQLINHTVDAEFRARLEKYEIEREVLEATHQNLLGKAKRIADMTKMLNEQIKTLESQRKQRFEGKNLTENEQEENEYAKHQIIGILDTITVMQENEQEVSEACDNILKKIDAAHDKIDGLRDQVTVKPEYN